MTDARTSIDESVGVRGARREQIHWQSRPLAAAGLLAGLFLSFVWVSHAFSEDAIESFESPRASWVLTPDAPRHLLIDHRRQSIESRTGKSAEFMQFDAAGREKAFGIVHVLPGTPVFNELKAKLWVKSNRPGIKLALRIRCPNAIDPESRQAVVFNLYGDEYTKTGEWQELTCVTSDQAIRERKWTLQRTLIGLGARPDINLSGMRVEALELRMGLLPGPTGLLIDDLSFGPLVSMAHLGSNGPSTDVSGDNGAAPGSSVGSLARSRERGPAPLDLSGGHIRLNGRPFVPRMTPYHGEPTDLLRSLGMNVVWLEDAADTPVIDALRSAGLKVAATPPLELPIAGVSPYRNRKSPTLADRQSTPTNGDDTAIGQVVPASRERADGVDGAGVKNSVTKVSSTPTSIGNESAGILFWQAGVRVPRSELKAVEAAAEAIRQSDRLYDRPRPVVADVVGGERRFSRRLDVTGSSAPFLHGARSPAEYFDELMNRRRDTLPGSPKTTWITTEPSPAVLAALSPNDRPAVVEPEQILMQAELALAAGYKGINYWTRSSLAGDKRGDPERRAAIELINQRIALLQPWIATGELIGLVDVTIGDRAPTRVQNPPIKAAVFQSEYGILVRFVWLDRTGQYVPGSMAARNVRAVVKAGETPRAYVITTTGVESIDANVIAGGTEITLPTLDQSATILITSYESLIEDVRQQVLTKRADAADAWVRMATAKLDRVQETHDRLQAVSRRPIRSGETTLAEARTRANRASDALEIGEYDTARQEAKWSMHILRRLQRDHWDEVVRELPTPQSNVHAICFETLPDYWRERALIGASLAEFSPLRGGDFADQAVMRDAGWRPSVDENPDLAGAVRTARSDSKDGHSLLLVAADAPEGADDLGEQLARASIHTPVIQASPGDLVEVTATLRALDGRKRGLVRVSDSVIGPALGASKLAPFNRWEKISLTRAVGDEAQIAFQFDIIGSGAAFIDDVATRVIPAADASTQPSPEVLPPMAEPRRNPLRIGNPLDLLPDFPELPELPDLRSFPSWRRNSPPSEATMPPSEATIERREVIPSPNRDNDTLVLPTIQPGHGLTSPTPNHPTPNHPTLNQ